MGRPRKCRICIDGYKHKDGFRKWIREQDLSKYTESDIFVIMKQMHLTLGTSVGKNTATHQAYGKIVVTLDCDNFTYRGGKFVIDHFEKHDYNCVMHQFDWNPQNGNFGRIAITKKKFNELGGYDQSFLPMGYQDWTSLNEQKQQDANTSIQLMKHIIVRL